MVKPMLVRCHKHEQYLRKLWYLPPAPGFLTSPAKIILQQVHALMYNVSSLLTWTGNTHGGMTASSETCLKERCALKATTTSMVWLKYCLSRGGLKATLKVALLLARMSS